MTDLKAILGAKLLAVIKESRERPTDYLVCVCDDYTTKIMSSCLRVHAINDAGVGAVVNINFDREYLPSTPAIYFLEPTAENWKTMLGDFAGKRPRYGFVHLYTTSPVPTDLLNQMKGRRMRSDVRRDLPPISGTQALRTLSPVSSSSRRSTSISWPWNLVYSLSAGPERFRRSISNRWPPPPCHRNCVAPLHSCRRSVCVHVLAPIVRLDQIADHRATQV